MRAISIYGSIDNNISLENREEIKILNKKRENFAKRIINNLITPRDLKGHILNVYKKFEEKTYEKGIFKKHMTSKQLENLTKVHLKNPEGLSTMTSIYNEAKFSQHKIREEAAKTMKNEFSKIKKQL